MTLLLPERKPSKYSPLIFWGVIAALFIYFLTLISPILLPFVVGMGVAYMLDPLADRLEVRGMGRTTATTIISGSFFLILGLIIVLVVPLLAEQIGELLRELPEYITTLQEKYSSRLTSLTKQLHIPQDGSLGSLTEKMNGSLQEMLVGVLMGLVKSGLVMMNFFALLLITPVVSFYLLRDWDMIVAKINILLPQRYAPVIREQMQEIDKTLAAFLRGTVNVMLVLVVYYGIALSVVGLPYSLLIALCAGVMIIIPYAGTIVSTGIAFGVGIVHFDTLQPLMFLGGIFAVGQVLESYVLTPRFVGKSVGLNPLWIIFGMMAGGALLGFVGVLIAVPATAVLGVLLRFGLNQYQRSSLYHGA
jgi:predicted PurR-regulated permease PerM